MIVVDVLSECLYVGTYMSIGARVKKGCRNAWQLSNRGGNQGTARIREYNF